MPIPPQIISRVVTYILRKSPRVYNQAGRVIQKYVIKKFGKYVIEIERRDILGSDGGISQIVRFKLNDITQEAWHLVVKARKIIHKHSLK